MKKIKFLIGAGIVAYEVYGIVKRSKDKKVQDFSEVRNLESKGAIDATHRFPVKKNKFDESEKRRTFRR